MHILKKILVIAVVITAIMNSNILSQDIGAHLGVMRNYSPKVLNNNLYSVFPEISLTWNFFYENLYWEWAFGYVNDAFGEDELLESKLDNSLTYNYGGYYNSTDYIFSTKLIINSPKVFDNEYIPNIISGISLHIINSEFVDHPESVFGGRKDENNGRVYFDVGLEHKITEVIDIDVIVRYLSLIPLNKDKFLHNQIKHSFVLVLKYWKNHLCETAKNLTTV